MAKTAATDGIANLVNCGTYVKPETIKNLHYFIELMTFGISTKASPMRFLSYRMKDFSWRYYRHLLVCTDCFVVVDGSFALIECTGPSFVLTGLSPCLGIASFLNTRHSIRIWQGRKGILAWKCLIFRKMGIIIHIKTTFDFFWQENRVEGKKLAVQNCAECQIQIIAHRALICDSLGWHSLGFHQDSTGALISRRKSR